MSKTESKECLAPIEYREVNEENTPCSNCGSRVHYLDFLTGNIHCSFCGNFIDFSSKTQFPKGSGDVKK